MTDFFELYEKCFHELVFTTSRSGGSGGQHTNKVETKVTLRWNIKTSLGLSGEQKILLLDRLKNSVNQHGELVLYHQTERSQLMNKSKIIKKWQDLIKASLKTKKKRKPTKPSKSSIAKQKLQKTIRSEVKSLRKKPRLED